MSKGTSNEHLETQKGLLVPGRHIVNVDLGVPLDQDLEFFVPAQPSTSTGCDLKNLHASSPAWVTAQSLR